MDGVILDCDVDQLSDAGIIEAKENQTEEERYIAKERILSNIYIPPEELEKMRESYSHSIVQDFDDSFHLSKEEREKRQKMYGKFIALRKTRKKVRRLDQYVEIHRLCMDILDEVAKENGVYEPEKFKKLVLTGKIYVNGLTFPKLQGKSRKKINWEYITENYIEDRERDPKELLREDESEDFVGEESLDESIVHYFGSKDALDEILEDFDEETKLHNTRTFTDSSEDEYVAEVGNRKSKKALIKSSPVLLDELKKRANLDKRNNRAKSYSVTDLDEEDMEFIKKYDLKRSTKTKKGYIPVFEGDITNKNDVNRYMTKMEEFERENTFVDYHGKRINIDDLNEINLKAAMEANGWNIRNLAYYKKEHKKMKKARKADEKKEKRLKQALLAIQERKEGREESLTGLKINSKKEKKLSKKKKKKVKKNHKKELKHFDDVLLDINGRREETFKEYRKEMENFSWMNR